MTNQKSFNSVHSGNEKPLSRKQREAIPCIIGARYLEDGCRKAGLSKGTLFRWMKDEIFKATLARQREAIIAESLQRLKLAITQAVDGLTELVESEEKGIKLRACEKVLDLFFKVKEATDIEERLDAIEKVMAEMKSRTL
jgi:hypothetical protein